MGEWGTPRHICNMGTDNAHAVSLAHSSGKPAVSLPWCPHVSRGEVWAISTMQTESLLKGLLPWCKCMPATSHSSAVMARAEAEAALSWLEQRLKQCCGG